MRVIAITAVLSLLAVSAGVGEASTSSAGLRGNVSMGTTSHVKTRWRATVARLPANAATGVNQSVSVDSISCASVGNCTAVGSYLDNAGDQEGLLLTEKAGHWKAGVEAVLPANAASDPQVSLTSVSCAAAGNCTAVGIYSDTTAGIYSDLAGSGLLLTETAGRWSAGIQAVLPASVDPDPGVILHSVSCASAGNCTAAGSYRPYPYFSSEGLLLTEKAGHWRRGVAYGNLNADLNSVSCSSDGSCSAVGYEDNSGGGCRDSCPRAEPVWLTKKRGKWRRVTVIWPPGGSGSTEFFTAVSCAGGGSCGGIGVDYFPNGIDTEFAPLSVLLTQKAGKSPRGVVAKPPGNAKNSAVGLAGISCASPGNCGAVGYYSRGKRDHLMLLTERAGKWRRGVAAVLPRGTGIGGAVISCASPGNCTVVGGSGFLLTEVAGRLAPGIVAPHFPGLVDSVYSVSCASPGNCGAVGVDGEAGILLESTTEPLSSRP